MLAGRSYSSYGVAKSTFAGVRFVLFGFDSVSEAQYQAELVRRGGIRVGRYDSSCTHVIVSGRIYDDPICVAARKDGKTLVTESWIDDSVDFGILADASSVIYRPVKDLNGIPGCESLCICLTGYQRQDRDYIMKMVAMMGARFSKPLIASQVTHLICYKFEGEKYELGKKVNMKLVNHEWLEDSLKAWEALPLDNYTKSSSWELEMLEAKARDLEEEADNGSMRAVGQGSIAGATKLQSGMPTTKPFDVSNQTMDVSSTQHECAEVRKSQAIGDPLRNKSDSTPCADPGADKALSACKLDVNDLGVLGGACDDFAMREVISDGDQMVLDDASSKRERKTQFSPGTTKRDSPDMADEMFTGPMRKTSKKSISPEKQSNSTHSSPLRNMEGILSKGDFDGSPLAPRQVSGNLDSAGIQSLKASSSIYIPTRNTVPDAMPKQSTIPSKAQSLSYKKHLTHRRSPLRDKISSSTGASLDGKVAGSAGMVEPQEASNEPARTTSNLRVSKTKSTGAVLSSTDGKEMKDLPFDEPRISVDMQTNVGNTTNNFERMAIGGKVRVKTSPMMKASDMAKVGSGKCEWTSRSEQNGNAFSDTKVKEAGQPFKQQPDEKVLPAVGGDSSSENALDTVGNNICVEINAKSASVARIKKAIAKRGLRRRSKPSVSHLEDDSSIEAGTSDKAATKLAEVKIKRAYVKETRKDKNQRIRLFAEDAVMEDMVRDQVHPFPKCDIRNANMDRVEISTDPEENKPTELQRPLRFSNTEQAWFILSGQRHQKKEFQDVIRRLRGKLCRAVHIWSYQATHLIVPEPLRRTEKFFAAAAAGRWILKTEYLTACSEAGKFIEEEPFEWCKNGLSEDGAIHLEAPRKWRLLRERTGHGAFYGLRIIVYGECIAPSLDTIKRAVKAGDGNILATSPPYTRILKSSVDFAIVSPTMPRVDSWVREFLKRAIPCVTPDYLVEYVCKPGFSLDRHVLYKTHAWAEKSFSNLSTRSEESVIDASTPSEQSIDDLSCVVCGSQDRGDVMLICGDEEGSVGCGIGTHIDCCNPPLKAVPEEDWFCPDCKRSGVLKAPVYY